MEVLVGKAERDKGARGERLLKQELEKAGIRVNRGWSLYGEPDLMGVDGIHVECKFVEKLNLREAMAQSIRDAEKLRDGAPTVFHKKSREEWLVTMRLADWIELYKTQQNWENLKKWKTQ